MRTIRPTAVLTVIAALAFTTLAVAAPVSAGASSQNVPWSTVYADPCFGEDIVLEGDFHTVQHYRSDATGGTHVTVNWNLQGVTGTGQASGATYRAQQIVHTTLNDRDPQTTFKDTLSLRLVGPGGAMSVVTMTVRLVQDASGETRVEVFEPGVTCTG